MNPRRHFGAPNPGPPSIKSPVDFALQRNLRGPEFSRPVQNRFMRQPPYARIVCGDTPIMESCTIVWEFGDERFWVVPAEGCG
jgi:hypothetical protein